MEEVLAWLGLNAKEAKFYLFLIEKGSMTAAQLAKELKESRTNVYTILERLAGDKLVVIDDTTAPRTYAPASPDKLKALITTRQMELRQANVALNSVLPELISQYNLGQHTPGVVYLEGINGYKKSLTDMAASKQVVSILASDVTSKNKEAREALEVYAHARKKPNHSLILFSSEVENEINIKNFNDKGYEVRFWDGQPHEGEVAIYDDKIAFTVYQPSLVVTIITNQILAATFNIIFKHLWANTKTGQL